MFILDWKTRMIWMIGMIIIWIVFVLAGFGWMGLFTFWGLIAQSQAACWLKIRQVDE